MVAWLAFRNGVAVLETHRPLVHEGGLPGLRRADPEFPTAQGQPREEDGHHPYPYTGGLRHPDILGALFTQGYGASPHAA